MSDWAIQRPVGTLALFAVVIVVGLFLLDRLPVSLLPRMDYPQVRIVINYPGVSPEVIEEQILRVLERNLAATENLISLQGRASEGRCYLDLIFAFGTDTDTALQDAARHLERARIQLPAGIDPPRLFKMDPSLDPIYEAAFSSTARSSIEVRDWLDHQLAPQLLSVPGVATVEAIGGLIREVTVTLDQDRIRFYGLTPMDVAEALARANVDMAAGNVTSDAFDIVAQTQGRFRSIADVEAVLLQLPGGDRYVPVSEIARVEDGHQEQRLFVRLNGAAAVRLSIMPQPAANTVDVVERVKETLARLESSGFIPPDLAYKATYDASFFVRSALRSVAVAAFLGAGLAMAVVFLFLGNLRRGLIVGLSIPLSLLAAIAIMSATGLTLNIMTLGGLALGVGLLLDNSIVVIENIARHQTQLSLPAVAAARSGSREVFSAVVAATLTNLAAVVPFLFLAGLTALLFREMVLTISFAIVVSLLIALTLVPMLAAHTGLVRSKAPGTTHAERPVDRILQRGVAWYCAGLGAATRRAGWVVAVAFLAFGGAVLLGQRLGTEFLPAVDDGRITMRLVLPAGTSPQVTDQISRRLERLTLEMPHVQTVFAMAGGYFSGGQLSIRGGMINFVIQLIPASQRSGLTAEQWVGRFQEAYRSLGIPDGRLRVQAPRIQGIRTSLVDADVSVGVAGEDLAQLDRLGRQVLAALHDIPGLEGVEIERDERTPLLRMQVDRERALHYGLTVGEIGEHVRLGVDGFVPTRYSTGGAEYDVRVLMPRSVTGTEEDLRRLFLFPPGRPPVLLGDVVTLGHAEAPAHILHHNQVRIVRINGDINRDVASVGQINREIRARLAGFDVPDHYSLIFGGEAEAMEDSRRALWMAILLAVFLVWVVLAVQYERIINPILILLTVPLAWIGVTTTFWVTGMPLSAPVFLGVVFLVGIVVNNAILFVEYIELGRSERQLPILDAVLEAGAIRLRPILMTTLTTIFGMLPLAVGLGQGSELMQPLAVSVVGGLLFATALTLVVIPCLYVLLHGRFGAATITAR
jgi:hydrophobe/amphiphile efflux-1 (HAE1) family protein